MAVVLITGCSSGFGLEAALAFAATDPNTPLHREVWMETAIPIVEQTAGPRPKPAPAS